jgi:hypothetical protein
MVARLFQLGIYAIDVFVDALYGLLPFVAATALKVAFDLVDSSLGGVSLAEVVDAGGKVAGLVVFLVKIAVTTRRHIREEQSVLG